MTGYGRASAAAGEGEITVEIRTVNHRFIDFSVRVPRPLSGFEREIEKAIRRRVRRGHVYVNVSWDTGSESNQVVLNEAMLRRSWEQLRDFTVKEGIPGEVDISTLLALPDIFKPGGETVSAAKLEKGLRKALREAVERCDAMRREEGSTLLADMGARLTEIEKTTEKIEKRAPKALEKSLEKTRKRIEKLLGKAGIDDERWLTEAAVIAEKTDFSEEIVRLKSHLQQFASVMKKGGEVSKKLTFLLQEIHREATTMGNKTSDPVIIRDCLAVKEQVEKIREQVQNLE